MKKLFLKKKHVHIVHYGPGRIVYTVINTYLEVFTAISDKKIIAKINCPGIILTRPNKQIKLACIATVSAKERPSIGERIS